MHHLNHILCITYYMLIYILSARLFLACHGAAFWTWHDGTARKNDLSMARPERHGAFGHGAAWHKKFSVCVSALWKEPAIFQFCDVNVSKVCNHTTWILWNGIFLAWHNTFFAARFFAARHDTEWHDLALLCVIYMWHIVYYTVCIQRLVYIIHYQLHI